MLGGAAGLFPDVHQLLPTCNPSPLFLIVSIASPPRDPPSPCRVYRPIFYSGSTPPTDVCASKARANGAAVYRCIYMKV